MSKPGKSCSARTRVAAEQADMPILIPLAMLTLVLLALHNTPTATSNTTLASSAPQSQH